MISTNVGDVDDTLPVSLVVGASGQVGTQMLQAMARQNSGRRALPTSRDPRDNWLQLDLAHLTREGQVASAIGTRSLDAVFCVGGMTNVDACEGQEDIAFATNARGPAVLATFAKTLHIPFVFYSTEYVFDGAADAPGPYAEGDPVNPLSAYGRSKLAGERAVSDANPDALILRTTVVYGPDSRQKNYLYSLMRNLAAGRPMRVPMDQVSTPTYNRDLIRATLDLVRLKESGIFHVCGSERIGRLQFAEQIAGRLELDRSLLHGVTTAELGQAANRPLDAGLSVTKLTTQYPRLAVRSVSAGLDDCMSELSTFLAEIPSVTEHR